MRVHVLVSSQYSTVYTSVTYWNNVRIYPFQSYGIATKGTQTQGTQTQALSNAV